MARMHLKQVVLTAALMQGSHSRQLLYAYFLLLSSTPHTSQEKQL